MRAKSIIPLIILLFFQPVTAEDLVISLDRSEIFVNPGDRVNLTLKLENLGGREVEVKGFELRIIQHVTLLPQGIQIGAYELPLKEPITLKPGERKEISRVFEVPRIAYSGDFSVIIVAETNVGEKSCELKVSLGITVSSAISTLLTLALGGSLIFLTCKALKRKLKPEHPVWRRIRRLKSVKGWREYDREMVSIMDERKAWGTFRDGVRYERHVEAIRKADELISVVLGDLREEERRLESEVKIICGELRNLEGKLSEDLRDYISRISSDKERMLKEMRALIIELERSLKSRVEG